MSREGTEHIELAGDPGAERCPTQLCRRTGRPRHLLARTIRGDRDLAPGRRHRNRTRSRTTGNEQWAAAGTSQPRVAGWLSAEWT